MDPSSKTDVYGAAIASGNSVEEVCVGGTASVLLIESAMQDRNEELLSVGARVPPGF